MPVLDIQDSELPPDLYHYTSGGGLLGILEDNALWATHAAYLNDAQEILYGHGLVSNMLGTMTVKEWSIPAELSDDSLWNPSLQQGWMRTALLKILLVAVTALTKNRLDFLQQTAGPFVTCLSAEPDQLSQWRGYAGDGGYAIRFDSELLRRTAKEQQPGAQLGFEHPSFGPVELGHRHFVKMEYEPDEKFIRTSLMSFFRTLLAHIATHTKDDPAFDQDAYKCVGNEIVKQRMAGILGIIMQLKNPGFSEENEYRIITFAEPDKFHPQTIGLVPRVDIKFDPTCVKEIIVGPGTNLDQRESSVKYFLKQRQQYAHVIVTTSKTPFRGT